jgi:mycothiol synthase
VTSVSIRQAGLHDLPGVYAVCQRALVYDNWSQPELQHLLWGDPDFNPSLALVAEEGRAPVGVAFGVVRRAAEGQTGFLKLIAADPGRQRQGIGRSLLAEMERRLQQAGAAEVRVSGSAPCYIWPGVDVRHTEAYCFFRDQGYERYADATNMTVELARAPLDTAAEEAALRQEGIEVRRLAEADREAFTAYMSRWSTSWQWEALASYRNDPITCHIALKQGQISGFAACDTNKRGWFGPMGTDQEMRRHGIGRILLKRCLRDQREAGYGKVEIAWTGPFHFYAKAVGARMDRTFWLMKKALPAG